VLGNLLWRFWLESQGTPAIDIHHLPISPVALEAQP